MNKFNFNINYINLTLFVILLIWLILIYFSFLTILFPFLSFLQPIIYKMFSLVCHQEKDKVFTYLGMSTNVCFRCLGLYWGAFISSFFIFFFSKLYLHARKVLFFIALILLAIDVFLVNLGVYKYNIYTSFLTGIFLGFICFLYLYKSIFEQFSQEKNIDD